MMTDSAQVPGTSTTLFTVLTYKGYSATVEFDAEDCLFFGRVNGITDIVTFHGESANELVQAFEQAVDGYLAPL